MEDLIYLDNGATSFPKPEAVYAFMDEFYRNNGVSPGRSGYDLSIETGNIIENTRKLLCDHVNGTDPNRLIFSANSTDALNLAIHGILEPGDHVITTHVEHNAVLRPLHHQSRDNGVEVTYLPFDENGFVHAHQVKAALKPNTKLVVVNHASNVIGTIQPVADIGAVCKGAGVLFLVDASQSAGKLPIDVQAMHIDVLAFTGHKSLLGPTGTGGLYVAEGVEIRHTRAGGTGVRSAVRPHLDEYPWRLEYGTLNVVGIAGLYAGLKWVLDQGMDKIHHREMELVKQMRDGLNRLDGVTCYCVNDLEDHIGVLSFNVEGMEAASTGTILDGEYNIAVRTGLQCAPLVHEQLGTDKRHGTVRMGFGPFNTPTHVEKALEAVADIVKYYVK